MIDGFRHIGYLRSLDAISRTAFDERRYFERMPSAPLTVDQLPISIGAVTTFDFAPVDPQISYPSYRSFDEFIDVGRLRLLDGYIRARIIRNTLGRDRPSFYTGPYRLNSALADRPGSRMIYLSCSDLPDSYFDLDRTEIWRPSAAANEFVLLMDFIRTLPFKATGRILIMYDDVCRDVPAHRDHVETDVLHEFIWFRTNLKKRLYLLNHNSGEKLYVDGYSAWFDTVNQFHGCDSSDDFSFSIRVDGCFTDDFRAQIPRPDFNAASTPSYWASVCEQGEVNEKGSNGLCKRIILRD